MLSLLLVASAIFLFSACDDKEISGKHIHTYGEPEWTWEGYTAKSKFTCVNDSSHTEIKTATVTIAVTKEAKCDENGTRTYTATVQFEGETYTDTKTQTIQALEHSYEETIVSEAKCTQNGTKKFTCENCTDSYTENYSLKTYSSSELFEYVEKSVAEIITYDKNGSEYSLGSGFVYSSDGKIITNYHVIEDSYSAEVTVCGKTYTVQKVLAYDKDIDIAVLKINASELPVIPVCSATLKTGATVYAIGSSQGLTATLSNGIITTASRVIDGVTYVQHNAAISSGNSGGPLANEYGEIIGINTFTIRDSQNLNFAIFVSELDNLSYGAPLTMAQLYEKESDVFTKLKNYIVENGEYDYEDNEYSLVIGLSYSSDYTYTYTRTASYAADDDEITLSLLIDMDCMLMISIDEVDGIYSWGYIDSEGYIITGTVYASTYDSGTLLGYSYNNISSSSLRSTIRELASAMLNALCSWVNQDLEECGVTAKDLGFVNY